MFICPQHSLNINTIQVHTILPSDSQSLLCRCNSISTINDLYLRNLRSSISFTFECQLLKSMHIFNHLQAQSDARSFFIHHSKACVYTLGIQHTNYSLISISLIGEGKTREDCVLKSRTAPIRFVQWKWFQHHVQHYFSKGLIFRCFLK